MDVYTTVHDYKASIAKVLLENEGMKVVVLNQRDTAYQAFGEISIYVEEKEAENASLLLKNLKH